MFGHLDLVFAELLIPQLYIDKNHRKERMAIRLQHRYKSKNTRF